MISRIFLLLFAASIAAAQPTAPAKLIDVTHKCFTDLDEPFKSAGVAFPTVCVVTFRIDPATNPASFTTLRVVVAFVDGKTSGCAFAWEPIPAKLAPIAPVDGPQPVPIHHAVCSTDPAQHGKAPAMVFLSPEGQRFVSRPL